MSRSISRERAREIADRYFRDGETPEPEPGDGAPEASAPKERRLSPKEAGFVVEYLVDLNATRAAIRAGYSEKTARVAAYELMRRPHVRAAIELEMAERARRTRWTADAVLQRLADELTADLSDLLNADGSLRAVQEWPLVWRMGLVAGIDIEEVSTGEEGVVSTRVKKIKLSDRVKRLELIGKHIGVGAFKEKVEHDVAKPLEELYRQIAGRSAAPVADEGAAPGDAPGGAMVIRPVADDDGAEPPNA